MNIEIVEVAAYMSLLFLYYLVWLFICQLISHTTMTVKRVFIE